MPILSSYSYLDDADNATVLWFKRHAGTLSTINVKTDCGAIADGNSHPLSTVYGSLAAAQAVYPFVTSLTQEIDYCACKLGSNLAFGGDLELLTAYATVTANTANDTITDSTQNWVTNEHAGKVAFRKFISNGFVESQIIESNTATTLTLIAALPTADPVSFDNGNQYAIGYGENGNNSKLNKRLYLPGAYQFGDDTWTIRNLRSGLIEGDGCLVTTLTSSNTALQFDGIWYSQLRDFSLFAGASAVKGALALDGNVPGHAYDTRGVQGVILTRLLMDGGGGDYAMTMTMEGGSSGQGSECVWQNCHWQNATEACYYQNGFNALANKFVGGNVQNYTKNGIHVVGGTISVDTTGFQSTHGYKQIENDGWDIKIGDAGAFEGVPITGCRSESLRFIYNGGAVKARVDTCVTRNAIGGWGAGLAYGPTAERYKAIVQTCSDNIKRLFYTETDFTSGGVEPTWPLTPGGTVADNGGTWTELPFNAFLLGGNSTLDRRTCSADVGRMACSGQLVVKNADYLATYEDEIIFVDATSGARTVTLPDLTYDFFETVGKPLTIKKIDASANAVTISAPSLIEGTTSSITIAGGSRGYVTVVAGEHLFGSTVQWHIIGQG